MEIKSSILILQPGMYVLRHPKGDFPPLTVSRAPGAAATVQGKLEILSTPATQGSILRDGADCIVMHVSEGKVELLVSAFLPKADSPVPSLKVDRIGLDAASVPASRPIAIADTGISLIGHIERTGDVVAAEGQQLGQPASTLRLEGFQVEWPDRPEGVNLAYNIAVEGVGALPMVSTGHFCGTRGQARRITEVTFVLTGPQAARYELDGKVCFTGGFAMPVTAGMPCSGPSGLEHLTSLSLQVRKARPASEPASNPWDESAKTKVFKSTRAAAKKKVATQSEKAAGS